MSYPSQNSQNKQTVSATEVKERRQGKTGLGVSGDETEETGKWKCLCDSKTAMSEYPGDVASAAGCVFSGVDCPAAPASLSAFPASGTVKEGEMAKREP